MAKDQSRQQRPGDLRRRAEDALSRKKTGEPSTMPEEDARALVHELQVHQIELQMQNEELKRANALVEETRDRYVHLYEFAPIGYLTLDENGMVLEANLTAAVQLGIERSSLIKRPFHDYIVPADRDKFRSHLNEVVTGKKQQSCEIGFLTKSGGDFYALLDTLFILGSSGKKLCRTTATDITQRRRAENLVNVRLNLLEFAASHSYEELLQKTLDEIGQLTNSPIGFLHFVESGQKALSLQAWSTRTLDEFCSAEGKGAHYPIEKAGVWVDCFHEKRPVIHNDYSALPHRKGLPHGHPPVIRELLVPIMRSGRIVAILGIGNKPEDYTQQDIQVASYLADVAWEITQRKKVEEELRRNQSRLDLALRSAQMGVWDLDLIENKRHFDDQVCHLMGVATANFTGTEEEFYKAVHPDDREMLKAVWARTIEQDLPYEAEYRALWPDGSVHYVSARGKLVHNDKGRPVMVNGLIWDTTDRKQMETAKSRLAAIVESSDDAIIGTALDGEITTWNRAAERIFGHTAEEVVGQSISILVPNDRSDEVPATLQRISCGKDIDHYDTLRRRKDGRNIHVSLSISAIKDTSGKIIGASSIARDITERKQMEDELRKSRDELELRVQERTAELVTANEDLQKQAALLNLAHDAISVVDSADVVSFWNKGAEDLYGFTREQAIGNIAYEFLQTRFPESLEQVVNLVIDKGQWTGELTHTTSREEELFVESRWALRPGEDGKSAGFLVVNRDITARKLAEEALRSNMARLELVNAELQEFVFVASHDLQEPLRKIQTFCDMAIKRCAPAMDGTGQEYLERVINSASRMRQLLRDLLQFSRVATRHEPFKKIDLVKIVLEAADVFEASVKETGCQIEVENIPAIEADESQMSRLFQNLIGNALKFRGDQTPCIRIYGKLDRKKICEIFVEDNGIGFDPQFAELIFKPFQRLHGRSEYYGTGMGLAICRKIVERHGGNIKAESEPGEGSTFIIRLPVKQDRGEGI